MARTDNQALLDITWHAMFSTLIVAIIFIFATVLLYYVEQRLNVTAEFVLGVGILSLTLSCVCGAAHLLLNKDNS